MKKKITALILSFIMVFALVPQTSAYEKEEIRAKISPELAEVMETAEKDELIPVVIFRNTIPKKTITELVLKETGKNLENYYDSILYEEKVKKVIEKAFETAYGKETAHITDEETGMSPVRTALHKDATELLKVKRAITKQEYEKSNNEFISKHINKEREITYNGMYTSTIITEATVEEIKKLASLNDVDEIMFYEPLIAEPAMQQVMKQIEADVAKNGLLGYNYGAGYKGRGSVIGVVEVDSKIDFNNPHFINNYNVSYVTGRYTPSVISGTDHATLVTALINGKAVNRTTYSSSNPSGTTHKLEGVAPEAYVYQTTVRKWAYDYEVILAIENLINNYGVNIINLSLGSSSPNEYSWYDRDVDNIISTTGVTIVVGAGNINNDPNLNVLSPGKAFGAITVGNANTKSGVNAPINTATFSMNTTSNYISPGFMPNKPDITAPGTNIEMATGTGSTSFSTPASGTSLAAPIVVGLAAHAVERDYSLIFNPASLKAWLILNADRAKISSTNNSFVPNTNSMLREKSGAGLVNARKIDLGWNGWYGTLYWNSYFTSTYGTYQWTNGATVRAVLVFGKNNCTVITSANQLEDIQLTAVNAGTHRDITKSINGNKQNVKIIEFSRPSAGFYFEIEAIQTRDCGCYNCYEGVPFSLFWRAA